MERGGTDRLEKGFLDDLVFALFNLNRGRGEDPEEVLISDLQRFYSRIWKVDPHKNSMKSD
jgi:hypothetical protein